MSLWGDTAPGTHRTKAGWPLTPPCPLSCVLWAVTHCTALLCGPAAAHDREWLRVFSTWGNPLRSSVLRLHCRTTESSVWTETGEASDAKKEKNRVDVVSQDVLTYIKLQPQPRQFIMVGRAKGLGWGHTGSEGLPPPGCMTWSLTALSLCLLSQGSEG